MSEEKNKIIIIDDDKFLLDMYVMKFNENHFVVNAISSADEAIEAITGGQKPDICLVDVIMPGMDGFTFLEELKKRNLRGDMTLIVLSNLGQREDIERALSSGADGYIIKASATPSEVVQKVKDILKNKKD